MVKLRVRLKLWFEEAKEWRKVDRIIELPEVPVEGRSYGVGEFELRLGDGDSLYWSKKSGWILDRTIHFGHWTLYDRDVDGYLKEYYKDWEVLE